MVYGTYNELVTGAYKPTNITGGPTLHLTTRSIIALQHLLLLDLLALRDAIGRHSSPFPADP